jgi:ABC-2 type transport system ATP-binding protein
MTPSPSPDAETAAVSGDAVIHTRGLTRYFGSKCAVDTVTLSVPRGSVFAFIGRNGAGKTTTIRLILGLLEPTRGTSRILGYPSMDLPTEARARIGYMAEGHPVYGWMRVGQYERFQRGFYNHWNQQIFSGVIDYFAIHPCTKAGHLSHGQRAGLHLAMTLAIEPEILMLDDPATGLDPAARRSLLEAMVYFTRNRQRTIFFSTHLLDDVERVADYVAVMDYSVLRVCCSADTFRERVRRFVARFPDDAPQSLPRIPGLLRANRIENELSLIVANFDGRTEHVLERLGALSLDEQPLSLEDALIAHVGRQGEKTFFRDAAGATP